VLTVPGKDKILGVTIVGEHAGDLLAEYVLAMKHGLGLNKILGTIHTYPTLAEANKYVAGEWKRAHAPKKLLDWVAAITPGSAHDNADTTHAACSLHWALPWRRRHGRHAGPLGRRLRPHARGLDGAAAQACAAAARRPGHAGALRRLRRRPCGAEGLPRQPVGRAGRGLCRLAKAERQAFLINAYNAFTVELILTRYPDLKSIKDLGSLLSSPWKPKWITLLGTKVSLDDIEHAMLRKRGDYDDPRVHFAVNCASIGCPALREEAFVANRLDAQMDEQTLRFMSDRTRNRYNAQRGRLELSKIFDWYGEDFRLGHRGIASLPAFAARYRRSAGRCARPTVSASARACVDIAFADYDWALNALHARLNRWRSLMNPNRRSVCALAALASLSVFSSAAPVQAGGNSSPLKLGVGMFQPDREKNDATYRPLAQHLAQRLERAG
jgi:hypothetical protein